MICAGARTGQLPSKAGQRGSSGGLHLEPRWDLLVLCYEGAEDFLCFRHAAGMLQNAAAGRWQERRRFGTTASAIWPLCCRSLLLHSGQPGDVQLPAPAPENRLR
jgi:hypothetical protein